MSNNVILFPQARTDWRVQAALQSIFGTPATVNQIFEQFKKFTPTNQVTTEEIHTEGSHRTIGLVTQMYAVDLNVDMTWLYTEIEKVLNMMYGSPQSNLITTGVYQKIYRATSFGQQPFAYLTAQHGSDTEGYSMTDLYCSSVAFKTDRKGASATAKMRARSFAPLPNEVVTIATSGSPTGGNATVTFLVGVGVDSNNSPLSFSVVVPYNATAASLLALMNTAFGSYSTDENGNANYSLTGGALPGTPIVITFQNALGRMRILPYISATALTPSGTMTVAESAATVTYVAGSPTFTYISGNGGLTPGTNEVLTISITGSPTSGDAYVSDGATKVKIAGANSPSAAQVQTALNTLWGANAMAVTGSAGGPYTATAQNQMSGKVIPTLTFTNTFLGGSSPSIGYVVATAGGFTQETVAPVSAMDTLVYFSPTPIAWDVNDSSLNTSQSATQYIAQAQTNDTFDAQRSEFLAQDGGSSFSGTVTPTVKETIECMIFVTEEGYNPYYWVSKGIKMYVRILQLSGGLDASKGLLIGSTAYKYAMWKDMYVQVSSAGELGDVDGTACWKYVFTPIGDYDIVVQNEKAGA